MMKLTKLLERLEYKVVQGNDDIEITEQMCIRDRPVGANSFGPHPST